MLEIHLGQGEFQSEHLTKYFFEKNQDIRVYVAHNPIQDGPFWSCSWIEGGVKKAPVPKICNTDIWNLHRCTLP